MRANALFLCVSAAVFFSFLATAGFAQFCAQVVTPAHNPVTGECKDFGTPCSVPEGWIKIDSCENVPDLDITLVDKNLTFSNSDVQTLSLSLKKWVDVSSFTLYLRGYKQSYAEYNLVQSVRLPLQSRPLNEYGTDYLDPSDAAGTVLCDSTQYNVYCNMKDFKANINVDLKKITSSKIIFNTHSTGFPASDLYYFVNREKYNKCSVPFPDSSTSFKCNTTQWGLLSGFEHTGSVKNLALKSEALKAGENLFSFSDSQKDPGSYVDSAVLRLETSGIYPSEVKIDFGGDGFFESLAQGETGRLELVEVEIPMGTVRDTLNDCEADENGVCTVNISFSPGSIGILNVLGYDLKEKQETLDGVPEGSIYLNKSISFSGKKETLFLDLPKGKVFETFDIYINSQPKNFIEYKLSGYLNPALKSSIDGHCENNLDNYCDYSDFNITIDKSKISSAGLVINAEALTNANGNLFYFLNKECSVSTGTTCGDRMGGKRHPNYKRCSTHEECTNMPLPQCTTNLDGKPPYCNQEGYCTAYVAEYGTITFPVYDCTYTSSGSLQFPFGGKILEIPLSLSALKDGLNTISVAEDAKDGVPMYVNYVGLKTYVPPSYISDVSVDFGNDGKDDFLYGAQTGWVKVSIPAETVNEYLENCEGEESCEVPIVFSSSTIGTIENIALDAQEEPLFTPVSNPFALAGGEGTTKECKISGYSYSCGDYSRTVWKETGQSCQISRYSNAGCAGYSASPCESILNGPYCGIRGKCQALVSQYVVQKTPIYDCNITDTGTGAFTVIEQNPLFSLLLLGGAAAVGVSLARRGSVGGWIEKLNPRTSQEIEAESQPVKSFEQKFAESTSTSKYWKEVEKARLERERERKKEAEAEAHRYRLQRRAETNAKWAALGLFPKPEPESQLEIVRNPNSIYFPRPEPPQVQTVTIEPKAIPVTITPEAVFSAEPVEQGFWGGLWNKAKDTGKKFVQGAKEFVGDAWGEFKETAKTYKDVPVIGGVLNGAVLAGEFTYGVGKSVYNTVKGLVYDLPKAGYTWATTSEDRWGDIKSGAAYVADGISWVASHPAETGQKLKELGQQAWSYCSGSAMNAGECVGEVAQLFVGGGAVGAAGKAGKAANVAGKAGKITKGAGKIGKGINGAADINKVGGVAGKLGNSAKLVEGATLAGSKGGKVQFPAIFKEAAKHGDDYATSLKVLKVEPAPKSLGKSASNIAKNMDEKAFSGYKIDVVYAEVNVGKEAKNLGKLSRATHVIDEETKTMTIILDKKIYKYATESEKKLAIQHEIMHPMLFKSDEPWKAIGLEKISPEAKQFMLKNMKDETLDPLQYTPVAPLPRSEYLVDYANLKLAQDSKYFSYLTKTKYKEVFPNGATKEAVEAFLKGKVDEIVADSTKRVGPPPSWVSGLPGIPGKTGHAALPVIGLPRAGGAVHAAAPAVKIPAKIEFIVVNGERVAVSGIERGLLQYKIVPITSGQKGHLGMLRGEIGKGARAYDAKLESIQYGDFGKRERWASTFYDTLHLDQKVSAAEMLRRGTISHEFAHMEIVQKRFASRVEFKNRPKTFKESYLSEAEADALIMLREGKGVFRNRMELLVGESEAYDAAKLLDGVKLSQREVENVVANELLAMRTGDKLLIGRAQRVSKLLVDKKLITKEQYAQIQTTMNNWLKNTIDKGRIGNEADAMKVQEKLMGF